ncbi:hypothetical protein GCM10027048_19120 [Hymenobacter coalescens]
MKTPSLLLRLTSLWLALLVLTASVGLTVQQHTCQVSGLTQRAVVLTPHHGCAPEEVAGSPASSGCEVPALADKATVQDGCCAFSAEHHKVDAAAHDLGLSKVPVPALLAVLPAAPTWPLPAVDRARLLTACVLHAADASPPTRAGRALLTFVCSWVV